MSRPAHDRAIVDAGLKALAFDSGPPPVCDEHAVTYERASDEHGRLGISGATNRLRLGDKVRLIPGPCDPISTPTLPSPASGGGLGRGVCRNPRQPRRAALTNHRPRRGYRRPSRRSISRGRVSRRCRAASADPACREPSLPGRPGRLSRDRTDRCGAAASCRRARHGSPRQA
jgi:hypothetical protein